MFETAHLKILKNDSKVSLDIDKGLVYHNYM